jgi:flotillin
MQLTLIGLLLFGLALVGAPIGLNMAGKGLGVMPSIILLCVGILLVLLCCALIVMTKLYVRTSANEAFVRTGMGGLKVVQDGGAIVLPILHQIVRVSLETIRLDVERKGIEALITADKLRADIKAEFFIRVQADDASIQNTARSLGDKSSGQTHHQGGTRSPVAVLIEDKLVSALRTSAARKTLEQLNSERNEFLTEVMTMVTSDLAHNGFTLESVTISKLDQTDTKNLKEDNIFDAQGMRTIAEVTQTNLTKRNEIIRRGEQERTIQDVAARQKILELDQTRAEAEAMQATQVATIQAEQARIAQEKQIDAERLVQAAQVEQVRLIQVAQQGQQRDIAVADQDRIRAITEAQQKVEVAKRAQDKAVAEAEASRALAQAKLAEAETERMKAQQGVITAEQIAAAEREKSKSVISATATAEQAYVKDAKAADAAAYKVKAEADARKLSADAEAEAIHKKAGAEASASKLRAEGEQAVLLAQAEGKRAGALAEADGQRAITMVPVDVAARQVEVDKSRVETVLVPELEAREKSGKAAQEYELSKLRIEAESRVRIEGAKVMATVLNKVTANVYGTPEDVAKMSTAFVDGMGLARMAGGFFEGANGNPALLSAIDQASKLVQATTDRISPVNPPTGE